VPRPCADKQRVTGRTALPVPTTDVVPLVRCKADAVRRSADSTLPHRQSAVLNHNRNAPGELRMIGKKSIGTNSTPEGRSTERSEGEET
jgi:hypothetical protein